MRPNLKHNGRPFVVAPGQTVGRALRVKILWVDGSHEWGLLTIGQLRKAVSLRKKQLDIKQTSVAKGRRNPKETGKMATKKTTTAEKRAKATEYHRRWRERKRAEQETKGKIAKAIAPAAVQAPARAADGLKAALEDAKAGVASRAAEIMTSAPVTDIAKSLGDDPESAARLRLLQLLREAADLRDKIRAKDFGVPAPVKQKKRG